jgi:two-component system, cell cycle response regulator
VVNAGGRTTMSQTITDRIKSCATLPSLPTIAMQVLDLAQKEEVDIAEIARIISKDPALSGKILRTVNSSFYGRAQAVSTISHALVILGLQSVKTLVLGFSLVGSMSKSKSRGFKHIDYWRHSMFAATAARSIAGKLGFVQQEEAFLIALLADIGMLVLDQVLGEEYSAVIKPATSHHDIAKLEQAALHMTHADVSGILVSQWKLPPLLVTPISSHHAVASGEATLKKLTEIVQFASRCADIFVDADAAPAIADVREIAKAVHGLEPAATDAMLAEIGNKTREVAPLFEINIGASESFESILKRASEALIDLTLQTQVESRNLQQQNEQLKQQALTDRLTGLNNRAAFDQKSQELWDAAVAGNRSICLLLLDLDKFKSINDTYGHPAGDAVLRSTGAILKATARPQDTAARYGGEELVLIMPGTPRSMAVVVGEALRAAIERKPVVDGATSIKVTASIGIASWEPGSPLKSLAHVIKAADLSLYNAKHSGRNRVKVFNPNPQPKAA